MLSHNYTYQDCLDNSKKVSWREDDVFAGKNFDFSKRFLPNKLTGVDEIGCLNDDEKRQLNQIMGNGYCHIFAFVEEFIVPTITEEAMNDVYGDEIKLRSLLRFAEEELKHQELFRRSVDLFGQGSDELGATLSPLHLFLIEKPDRRVGLFSEQKRKLVLVPVVRVEQRIFGCPLFFTILSLAHPNDRVERRVLRADMKRERVLGDAECAVSIAW